LTNGQERAKVLAAGHEGLGMTVLKSFGFKGLLMASLLCAASAPGLAQAQQGRMVSPSAPQADPMTEQGSIFKCDNGNDMVIKFLTRNADLYAIVDTGAGPHDLALKPWVVGDEPQITWSDGVRTLTWSAGVQLMLMDGPTHLMCGRAEHEHHHGG
jgi:hypothetical protein